MVKCPPFSKEVIESLAESHATPFYVYDAEGIKRATESLASAFSWNKGFREYFAVKATPNPSILQLLRSEGCGADCSSMAELLLAERAGMSGDEIMFTSNDTPIEEYRKAVSMGALINLDALEHIAYLEKGVGLPEFLSFRYNPGPSRSGNVIIGIPEEAKFGMTRAQLFEGYRLARQKGVKRFGLHAMVASNERDVGSLVETARMLFELVREIKESLDVEIELVNLGGGIGIPYRPEDEPVDVAEFGTRVEALYERMGLRNVRLAMECGRFITGPHGYLVSRVRHLKHTYRKYVGVDASMADLMRPGMYGAYHHISVLGKEGIEVATEYDIVGPLCENNDKFAVQRRLPALEIGDLIVVHDAGAHGRAMGFNYNGQLRAGEFLMRADGTFDMIRRRETHDDLFATFSF